MSEPKITILPYAGPEVMGNGFSSSPKPSGARIKNKTNGTWHSYYNPPGETGGKPKKKEKLK